MRRENVGTGLFWVPVKRVAMICSLLRRKIQLGHPEWERRSWAESEVEF